MALLDRVKERVETDLGEAELQLLIDEALTEIIQRFGPHADSAAPTTVRLPGDSPSLFPNRPVDETNTIEIVETVGTTETTLASNDFRLWHGGRRLERLNTGNNPRSRWGHPVEITYTPINDGNQREEAVIKLVQLSIDYQGVKAESIDGYSSSGLDYRAERDRILSSLGPSVHLA